MTPKKLMCVLFSGLVFLLASGTLLNPKKTFSENENRFLEKKPSLINLTNVKNMKKPTEVFDIIRWEDYFSRSYMLKYESYISDHFINRESWISGKNNLELFLGKKEINGVFVVDDFLIESFKSYDQAEVDKSLEAINSFSHRHKNVPSFIILAPTAQEIYSDLIPPNSEIVNQKNLIEYCYNSLDETLGIDVHSLLLEHSNEYIYYKTDHHWTSLGAYFAYLASGKKLGYTFYDRSNFEIEYASNKFKGTLYSKTLNNQISDDLINYFHLRNKEPNVKISVNDGASEKEYYSLYFREFLDKKDKYSSFLGANAPIVTIETDLEVEKSLLIFKDSYANSLVPFLSKHYSKITLVDMRYIRGDYEEFVDVESYSQVLFMYNIIGFSKDSNIKLLKK